MTCDTCRWWNPPFEPIDAQFDLGHCRRMPPTTTSSVGNRYRDGHPVRGEIVSGSHTGWPETRPQDWCGEWKAKGEEPA